MGAVVAFVGGMFLAAVCIGLLNAITAIIRAARESVRSFRRAGRLIREVQNQEGTCRTHKAKSPRPT